MMRKLLKSLTYTIQSQSKSSPTKPALTQKSTLSYRKVSLYSLTFFLFANVFGYNWLSSQSQKLQYILHTTVLNQEIINNTQQLSKNDYTPTLYLLMGALSMIWARYVEGRMYVKNQEEIWDEGRVLYVGGKMGGKGDGKMEGKGETGGKIGIQGEKGKMKNDANREKCVLIVGGSQGNDNQMQKCMLLFSSNKFQTIGINVNDLYNPKALLSIISRLKQQRKQKDFYAIGIEYGANLLIMAAALDKSSILDGIVSIGNPLSLEQAQNRAMSSWIANRTFVSSIVQGFIYKSNKNIPNTTPLSSLPILTHGIPSQSLLSFKQQHSSINYLSSLQTPTLLLNSKQDPLSIYSHNNKLSEQIQKNDRIISIFTRFGGHLQWYENMRAKRWASRLAIQYVKTLIYLKDNRKELFVEGVEGIEGVKGVEGKVRGK